MPKLRPYLALDIETTGLNLELSHVLQLGWVIDDGTAPVGQLPRGSIIVEVDPITYGEPVALKMNAWIFDEIGKALQNKHTKYPVMDLTAAMHQLVDALAETWELCKKFDAENGDRPKRVQIAGKNVASFDWPIILNNLRNSSQNQSISQRLSSLVDHRFIDVGATYFDIFGKNPGFGEINKLIQHEAISHDAVDDALNVVVALRKRMGMNF